MIVHKIEQHSWGFTGHFKAMASPCQILLRTNNGQLASQMFDIAATEAQRFEAKYSRYVKNNLCDSINHSNGRSVSIDDETFRLLEYAASLYQWSDGLFDISSGILRRVWHFDQSDFTPLEKNVRQLLPFIGFDKIAYDQHQFCMPKGMEIDFGGIGKEYCADRIAQLLAQFAGNDAPDFLVNLGGDLVAYSNQAEPAPWQVGVESVTAPTQAEGVIQLGRGAIATSGTTKRYLRSNGKLLGHILNPKTGYPVENAARSISVLAESCTLAGSFATLAMLQGDNAESFLEAQQLRYWVVR